jgi:putative ABC transport system permease protein
VSVLADLRIALRTLLRVPGFFGVATLVLGPGIAAVVVMFGFLRVILTPPPLERMDRVFSLSTVNVRHNELEHYVALQDIEDWSREQTSFEGVAGVGPEMVAFRRVGADVEPCLAGRVTGMFFPLLRVKPLLGRNLVASDALPNAAPVVVLSERLWRSDFNANPSALGQNVLVNGDPHEVVGVAPAALDLPVSAMLWFPDRTYTAWDPQLGRPLPRLRGPHMFPIGRLRDGVTPDAARTELRAIQARRVTRYPLVATEVPDVRPISLLWMGGDYQRLQGVLFGSVLLVLALACVNVAGLLLVRGAGRTHEAAVRRALGAGRLRLAGQMLAESAVIGAASALLGLVLSAAAMELLRRVVPALLPASPSWWRMRLDALTVAFALGTAVAAAVAAGLYPAFRATGASVDPLLRDGQRETGLHAGRLMRWLVVLEIALSSALLAAAGLVIRSGAAVGTGDVGVSTDGFLMVRIELPQRYYESDPWNFAWRLATRIRVIPDVESIAVSTSPPGITAVDTVDYALSGSSDVRVEDLPTASMVFATPGFFESFRIPVRGRPFVDADNDPRAGVAVVSESMARTAWPGEDPLGKMLRIGPVESLPVLRVVGVAQDVRYDQRLRTVGAQPPLVYMSLFQWTQRRLYVTLRARRDALAAAEAVRMAVRSLDLDVAVFSVRTLDEERRRNAAPLVLVGRMFAAFGAVALALAAAGVYGVVAYSVAQGAREIAIRRALGAPQRQIVAALLARSGWQLALGLALGFALAPAIGAVVGSGVIQPKSGLTVYLAVAAVLSATLLASVLIPLRRALLLEAAAALRHT